MSNGEAPKSTVKKQPRKPRDRAASAAKTVAKMDLPELGRFLAELESQNATHARLLRGETVELKI